MLNEFREIDICTPFTLSKVVAMSASSIETHPQDGPEKMVEDAKKYGTSTFFV